MKTNIRKVIRKLIKEERVNESKYDTLIAIGKDTQGKKIEMIRTIRWGGLVTHILKKNGKEYDQYPPNLKPNVAIKKFKKDFRNVRIGK